MDRLPRPSPTPAADGQLPRSAPLPRRSCVVPPGAGGRRRVRELRARARTVTPLDHAMVLDGLGPERRVAVLGDSAAAGHGLAHPDEALARRVARALHERDARATRVVCVARDGATTRAVLTSQLVAATDAEVVVVGVGVNDALRGTPAAASAAALREVLVQVRGLAAPGAAVVLLGCPDLSGAPVLPPGLRTLVGVRCRAIARAQRAVASHLDVPVVVADRSVVTPEVFGTDGFHPGARGHAQLAQLVVARVGVPPPVAT